MARRCKCSKFGFSLILSALGETSMSTAEARRSAWASSRSLQNLPDLPIDSTKLWGKVLPIDFKAVVAEGAC
eukprot:4916522-Pyramimonas_sp.AAC.1